MRKVEREGSVWRYAMLTECLCLSRCLTVLGSFARLCGWYAEGLQAATAEGGESTV